MLIEVPVEIVETLHSFSLYLIDIIIKLRESTQADDAVLRLSRQLNVNGDDFDKTVNVVLILNKVLVSEIAP